MKLAWQPLKIRSCYELRAVNLLLNLLRKSVHGIESVCVLGKVKLTQKGITGKRLIKQ